MREAIRAPSARTCYHPATFPEEHPMTRLASPRLILAIGLIAALSIAVAAQQRSTATSMTTAATNFLASLNPEQRQQEKSA